MDSNNVSMFTTPNNFKYSAIDMDNLDAGAYTIVNVLVDVTLSVSGLESEIENCLKTIVDACEKDSCSETLLVRVATFSSSQGIVEQHGFVLLNSIDKDKYTIKTGGMTNLYDAILDCIETTEVYAKDLQKQKYDCNAIFYVITDGCENDSVTGTLDKIKSSMDKLKRSETCESVTSVLVGLADTYSGVKDYLMTLKDDGGLDEYVSVGDATPSNLAKLGRMISQSISSTSQALGSGGPSQTANFTL